MTNDKIVTTPFLSYFSVKVKHVQQPYFCSLQHSPSMAKSLILTGGVNFMTPRLPKSFNISCLKKIGLNKGFC